MMWGETKAKNVRVQSDEWMFKNVPVQSEEILENWEIVEDENEEFKSLSMATLDWGSYPDTDYERLSPMSEGVIPCIDFDSLD